MYTQIFTAKEVAILCDVREATVRKWVEREELNPTRIGGHNYFDVEAVSALLWEKDPLKAMQFDEQYNVRYDDCGEIYARN